MARKKKVLVIVAHPDDETIWMGGTLLKHKNNWDITILSLCRRDDADRAPKFKKVCEIYNAKCFMSDLEDEELREEKVSDAVERIKKFIVDKYDYIFTHGENGEYGHKRHLDVHKAVKKMLQNGNLHAKKVFFFSYIKKGKFCYVYENSTKLIKLNSILFEKKKQLIQKIYGFDKGSFEDECCRKIEGFKIKEKI